MALVESTLLLSKVALSFLWPTAWLAPNQSLLGASVRKYSLPNLCSIDILQWQVLILPCAIRSDAAAQFRARIMTVGDQPLMCRRNGGGKLIYFAFVVSCITDTEVGSFPS